MRARNVDRASGSNEGFRFSPGHRVLGLVLNKIEVEVEIEIHGWIRDLI